MAAACEAAEESTAPRRLYRAGDEVSVFYRIGTTDSYLPVATKSAAVCTPRVGQSHGWVAATVLEDCEDREDVNVPVRVRYDHLKWVDRTGKVLAATKENAQNLVAVHPARRVRPISSAGEAARTEVTVSVLMVRWAEEVNEDPTPGTDRTRGWGPTGSVVSDGYARSWIEALDVAFPGDYQVVTAFVHSSADLASLAEMASALPEKLTGRHWCAMYFLWPVACLDQRTNLDGISMR